MFERTYNFITELQLFKRKSIFLKLYAMSDTLDFIMIYGNNLLKLINDLFCCVFFSMYVYIHSAYIVQT